MNDVEFQKLLNADPPLVLKTSNRKWIYLIGSGLVLILLVIIGIFAAHPQWIALIIASGFCLFRMYISLKMIIYSDKFLLLIDNTGFTVKESSGEQRHEWRNISEFRVRTTIGRGSFTDVYFNDTSQTYSKQGMRKANAVGMSAAFPDTNNVLFDHYGMDVAQLAYFMNHWRERALAGK